jgi:hypothetical protein
MGTHRVCVYEAGGGRPTVVLLHGAGDCAALVGEGSLCLWLLVLGVNVERWNKAASAALRMRSTFIEALR